MLANKQPPRRDYAEEVLPPLRLSPRAPSHVSSTPASRLKGPEGSRSALPSFAFPYNTQHGPLHSKNSHCKQNKDVHLSRNSCELQNTKRKGSFCLQVRDYPV